MIAQFALRLLCGISLMWCLMPREKVTTGFFRIQMLVGLGLSVLAMLTVGHLIRESSELVGVISPTVARAICIFLVVATFVGSVTWTLGRRTSGDKIIFAIAGVSSITLLLTSRIAGEATGWAILRAISEVSTASIIGAAVTSMLLGHWYLTAPTMSVEPLTTLTWWFFMAAILRMIVSAVVLWLGFHLINGQTHWIWIVLRWVAGIAGPLLMCAMVWRIMKYKNTQSATGVLFAGVILTFIGELTATLLDKELSLPF